MFITIFFMTTIITKYIPPPLHLRRDTHPGRSRQSKMARTSSNSMTRPTFRALQATLWSGGTAALALLLLSRLQVAPSLALTPHGIHWLSLTPLPLRGALARFHYQAKAVC